MRALRLVVLGAILASAGGCVTTPRPDQPRELSWYCDAQVMVDGFSYKISRRYHPTDIAAYWMMFERKTGTLDYFGDWRIDPRPDGPPRRFRYDFGARAERDSFQGGPNIAGFRFSMPRPRTGPVTAEFSSGGVIAGSYPMLSVHAVRTYPHYPNDDGRITHGFSLVTSAMLRPLSAAPDWRIVARDGAGRTLFEERFTFPTAAQAERAYREGRARLDAMAAGDHPDCQTESDEEAEI